MRVSDVNLVSLSSVDEGECIRRRFDDIKETAHYHTHLEGGSGDGRLGLPLLLQLEGGDTRAHHHTLRGERERERDVEFRRLRAITGPLQ